MKSRYIIYPSMVGLLCFSCGNRETDTYTESLREHVAEQSETAQDGVRLENLEKAKSLGHREISELLGLPEPLVVVLQNDSATSVAKIQDIRKFNEQGKTFYEITFIQPVGERKIITYDDLGKVRSPDLKDTKTP